MVRLSVSIASVVLYCTVIVSLMYVNTVYLSLGDPKFGEDGWEFYWYIWALFYSPMLIYGFVLNYFKNDKFKDYIKCNLVFILFLAVFIEISFIKDISWPRIIIEYLIIGVGWIYVLKLKKFLSTRQA